MISCILTITILVQGQSYEEKKEFVGKRLRSEPGYWIMDFSEKHIGLKLPVKVDYKDCEKL